MALILTFSQREKGLRGIPCITPMTVNQSHLEQVLVFSPLNYGSDESVENRRSLGSYFSAPKVGLSHPPARKMPLGDAPRPPPEWAKPSLDSPVFDEPQSCKTMWTKH